MTGGGTQVRPVGAEQTAALVQRSRQGDRSALETLLEDCDHEVLNVAYRLIGNRDDALDIRQQTYLRVVRSIAGFDGRSSFRTWLLRIVINASRDHIRRIGANRRRADGWSQQAAQRAADQPATACASEEQSQRVAAAVAQLPDPQREVLVLRQYHDMTLTAAARVLDIPLSTAASRLSSAMQNLRDALTEREPCGCHSEGVRNAV
jgi:RNA polymerase sigma-70 factor (ECF subfamily)